jgi:hypothetical protein
LISVLPTSIIKFIALLCTGKNTNEILLFC